MAHRAGRHVWRIRAGAAFQVQPSCSWPPITRHFADFADKKIMPACSSTVNFGGSTACDLLHLPSCARRPLHHDRAGQFVQHSEPGGDDVIKAVPGESAATILDKYIQAIGGAQKLNGLTSYVATGKSIRCKGLGDGSFTIYTKAPDQKTTQISFKDHSERGEGTWDLQRQNELDKSTARTAGGVRRIGLGFGRDQV